MNLGRQAGILWLLVAAMNFGVAWLAFAVGSDLGGSDQTALSYAALGLAAGGLVALYAGIRLLIRPSKAALFGATVWGAINAVLVLWTLVSGADVLTAGASVFVVLAAVASFMAWREAKPVTG